MNNLFRILNRNFIRIPEKCSRNQRIATRNYSKQAKRFYKNTGILYCDGTYEITLDHRKLKTPKGNVMKVDNEMLALMIATEWDSQKKEIRPSTMHLTALVNTALENPNNVIKEEAVDKLVDFIETDTILYHSLSEDVNELQKQEWDPVISWFSERFEIDVVATTDLVGPPISEEIKDTLRSYLLSYNMSSIHGFILAIESLKSIILALACVERRLTVDKAVLLSRLEEEFQAGRWGRVEWAHDISQIDLQSRVAAGVLFVQLNSMSEETKTKLVKKFK